MVRKTNFCLFNIRKSIFIALSVGIFIILSSLALYDPFSQTIHAQPSINDDTLSVEPVVEGLSSPTSMIFLDDNDILVLEKTDRFAMLPMEFCRSNSLQIPVNAEMKEDYLELLFQTVVIVLVQILLISFFIILKEIL